MPLHASCRSKLSVFVRTHQRPLAGVSPRCNARNAALAASRPDLDCEWMPPLRRGTLTMPTPSPQRSRPGACNSRGKELKPPLGLDYRDASLSVHDLLQELKTHPEDPQDPRGRRARRVGREDDPERRLPTRCPASCTRRACSSAATASGMVNIPRLKGVHYAIESGRLAAEAAFRALQRGETPATRALVLRRRGARELHLERPARGAGHAPGLRSAASSSAARLRAR